MFKMVLVGTIAKRFVPRATAAAKGNDRSALEAVGISVFVYNFKVTFYFNRAVVVNGEFCCCHEI